MSTVRRDFRASPQRTGSETWEAMTKLLAPDANSAAHKELLSVKGIAGQLIATESAKDHPIISAGSGPRVRIYCVYDDDALDEENANESKLAFDATAKDWKVSIPVEEDDVEWSKAELGKLTKRITVREKTEDFGERDDEADGNAGANSSSSLALDISKFLKQ